MKSDNLCPTIAFRSDTEQKFECWFHIILLPDVTASGYLRFTICSPGKWNKELDRSYTVKVWSQINMVNRILLKLEQYRKWVDRTLLKLKQAILLKRV